MIARVDLGGTCLFRSKLFHLTEKCKFAYSHFVNFTYSGLAQCNDTNHAAFNRKGTGICCALKVPIYSDLVQWVDCNHAGIQEILQDMTNIAGCRLKKWNSNHNENIDILHSTPPKSTLAITTALISAWSVNYPQSYNENKPGIRKRLGVVLV